jgi:hypothetical protein
MEPVEVNLRDLGTGYPDLKTGDGLFSAYFTKFSPEPGHYLVEVLAAYKNTEREVVAGSFYMEQATGFYIREGSNVPVNDVFPPSRVTDLNVEGYLEESYFVYMSWSAPGGDYDSGRALRYEIRCSTNRESLRNERYREFSILVDASLVPTPLPYGDRQECSVGVPWPGQMFYYGVVAVDESGNRGEMSNIVTVRIDKKEEPTVTLLPFVDETSSAKPDPRPSAGHEGRDSLIAYICCSLILVSALLAFALWRMAAHFRQRRRSGHNSSQLSDKSQEDNVNNVTTEDIWSLASGSDAKTPEKAFSLGYVSETQHPSFIYNDLDLLKDLAMLPPPRDSVLEDMSVYRDLSYLDPQSLDYFALSRRLSSLLYCDDDSKRQESLV